MVFSSIIFLWVLLPCILLLYYVSPKPFKNGILTVFSLFFYACFDRAELFLWIVDWEDAE